MNRSLIIFALLTGCSEGGFGGAADLGVTQGGSQDIRQAREIIEAGGIPSADQFTAEGLFSEHDLPLGGDECEEVLCPRAAAARVQLVDGSDDGILVQLGFGTSIDADTFERAPLNLGVAMDVSGSMSGEKIEAARKAMEVLVSQLDGDDRMALVAFDDQISVLSPSIRMDADGRARMLSAINDLQAGGSTWIDGGLGEAFSQVAPRAGTPGVNDRVMLFTDAQPNVGATGMASFMGMTRYYAEADIGLSLFGVGLDLGSEMAQEMTQVRGGSYHFLSDGEAIAEVFSHDFDYLVTPVAYDLDVEVRGAEGLRFEAAYGTTLDQPDSVLGFGASTLFLSRRDGGMGAILRGDELPDEGQVARFELSFETADGSGRIVQSELRVGFMGGEAYVVTDRAGAGHDADDLGVFKMAVLIDELMAMQAGAGFCSGDLEAGVAARRVRVAGERLADVASQLEDPDMESEATLMDELGDNIAEGSARCSSY